MAEQSPRNETAAEEVEREVAEIFGPTEELRVRINRNQAERMREAERDRIELDVLRDMLRDRRRRRGFLI